MPEVFYGPWDVRVVAKDAAFDEQVTITGSDAADGNYPGVAGAGPGTVTGTRWELSAQWNDNAGSGWQESDLRRSSATYTLAEGLLVTIGVDDNLDAVRDFDYNDVLILCRSLDPRHIPLLPVTNPYDFTVDEKVWRRYVKTHRGRDGVIPRDPEPVPDPDRPNKPAKPSRPPRTRRG